MHSGRECNRCNGFGFLHPDGTVAEVHAARGGFYEFGAIDAVFETMCNIKLAYAGAASEPRNNGWYPGTEGCEYYFVAGPDLLAKLCGTESQRFATRTFPDRNDIEAWLLPTPSPARARLMMSLNTVPNDLVVWYADRKADDAKAIPLFVYHAMQHCRDMNNEAISQVERVTRVMRGDYTVHPEHDGVCEALPRPDSAVLKLNPVMRGEPIQSEHCSLRSAGGVAKLKRLLPRTIGPVALSMEMRGEKGATTWSGSSFMEIMTL
ncbi:MAG: hypothetical protein O7G84_13820 [Gammaproteobacteria bacterium]|nr:hypothetical protein [Gammaproteobacteria bacterium]